MMNPRIVFLFIFLMAAGSSVSQVISFSAAIDKERIVIGEPLALKLEAVVPVNAFVRLPDFDTLPHFEVLGRSGVDSTVSFNGLKLEQTVFLTSWDSGSWFIPSLSAGRFSSAPLRVDVGYSPMDPDQPYHDIKDILDVRKPEGPGWYWYLLAAVLLLVLFLLFFPSSKKQAIEKKPVADEPYKKAMKNLSVLDPAETSAVFFTRLVNIYRDYLQEKKNIMSFSKTTDDLVIRLRELSIPQDAYAGVAQVLRMSDLAKYARFEAQEEEKVNAIKTIKENIILIENSR